MSLLGLLPWELVRDVWGFGQVVLLAVLAGPFTGPLLLTRPVQWELLLGNISLLLAAVSVAGLRWPALWSIAILTKVTPGIGLLWFVARREWRNLGIAAGATAVIVVVSFALAPGLWVEWAGVLVANRAIAPNPEFWMPPLVIRIAFAAALIWYGARRGWQWVVPVAVMLSTAHLWAYAVTTAVGALWWAWTSVVALDARPLDAVASRLGQRAGLRLRRLGSGRSQIRPTGWRMASLSVNATGRRWPNGG